MILFTRVISSMSTLSLVLGLLLFSNSSHAALAKPKTQSVAFLPTDHISNALQPNFKLENAQIIDQNETGFFLEELKATNQLCNLKTVSCLASVGQLLGADLIIQVWTDPAKNDVFRFLDISLKQEIHREIIPKGISEEAIYQRIKSTYEDMYVQAQKTKDPTKQKTKISKQSNLAFPRQQISKSSDALSLNQISGWSAVGVGSAANIIGGLFYFLHPVHSTSLPNDASQAFKTQIENTKQNKKEVAYALWASGASLTIAGLVQLFNQDTTE